eukprot:CAMPEP_0176440868 /NCGR_PEP_ID=MMETSP0127-20121128/20842_1 /TAXON_ID=938130 /ORGANISM="Platyophrya macrostoma, Strain WH" /LENGTH=196 /DNA_ID=CAMNT_0017825505 /DNA_START=51 /DNA_END=641 /DNA_ORIENTATION=-
MTSTKTMIATLFFFVVCFNAASADFGLNCDTLQAAFNTVKGLSSSTFKICSIDLNQYFIPSWINSVCANAFLFAETDAVVNSIDNGDVADDEDEMNFLQSGTSAISEGDVVNALIFDTLFVNAYAGSNSYGASVYSYCQSPLIAYFSGSYFPNSAGTAGTSTCTDNSSKRKTYLSSAVQFYKTSSSSAYKALGCTF